MLKLERNTFWAVGLCVTVLTFILVFIGIKVVASIEPGLGNMIAYIIFSLLVGGAASILVYFRFKIALSSYLIGILLGFFFMYKSFFADLSGWGDLIGILSLMTWIIIGLGIGLLGQLIRYLYKKFKKVRN